MSQTFKLYRLQQVDSQMDSARARLREIEVALTQNQALVEARQRLEQASQALETERKKLKRAEEETHQQRIKIEQTDSSLYGGRIRSPKELQDLQNEAAALRRHRSVLEDRQLEAMLAVEEAETAYQDASDRLDQVTARFEEQSQSLIEEQTRLQKDVSRLEAERAAATSSIPENERLLYDQLRQQRRGIAVSKVTDKACSACGSVLSAALLSAARSPSQLSRCDFCGRILYAG